MLRYINATVRLSELHSQHVTIPAWELPLLEALHGASVTATGDQTLDRPVPDAADEFSRLATKYRHPENRPEAPFVAQVYGAFGPGVAKLKQEIERAVVKPKAKRAAKAAKPATPAAETSDDVDPLVA